MGRCRYRNGRVERYGRGYSALRLFTDWCVKLLKKKKRYYHCVHFSVSLHFLLLKCDFWKHVKSPTPICYLFPSECVCDSRLISSLELLFCTCLSSVFSYSHVIFQHVTSIVTCPPSCGSSGYYTVCNL